MARYKSVILWVVSTLLLMCIALYNGYPLYDGDTHAYLTMGFSDVWHTDRPVFYGMFLRVTSAWTSLWLSIFAQSGIVAFLLLRYIRLIYGPGIEQRFLFLAVLVITAFTGLPWVCAYLMPDVFGAILMLTVLLYLLENDTRRVYKYLYLAVMLLAVLVHNAHFLILCLFSLFVFTHAAIYKLKERMRKAITMGVIGIGCYLIMCMANFQHKVGFVFSPSAKVFTMAKFAQSGILDLYLNDNCGKKELRLCSCKGQIPPYPWDFMWPPSSSPLSKIGVWDSCGAEFDGIIHDVLTTPKYLKIYAMKSGIYTCRQLFQVGVSKPLIIAPDTWQGQTFKTYFAEEFNEFSVSGQNLNLLDTDYFNLVYYLFFLLSSVWVLLFYSRSTDGKIYRVYCAMLLFFIVNAFVLSTFSMVHPRYQYRIFWLLPATNAILILRYLKKKYLHSMQVFLKQDI